MNDEPACFGTINFSRRSACARCAMAGPCSERLTQSQRWGVLLWPRLAADDVLPDVQPCEEAIVAEVAAPLLAHGFSRASGRAPSWRYSRRRVVSLREANRTRVVALFHNVAPQVLAMLDGFRSVVHEGDTFRGTRQRPEGDYTVVSALSPASVSALAIQVAECVWRKEAGAA